ncbi:uncharacterized protein YndB with AHSA1/START domain [Staphylococcus hominis]
MSIEVKENKIIFSRTFKASINDVFDAYTNPSLFEQWFHPQGAKTKVYRFNVKEGGEAFFAIETPEQTSYTLTEYQKVDRPNYLEYLDYFATPEGQKDTRLPGMHISINFKSDNKQMTTVTSTSMFPTKEEAQQAVDMGVEVGMNSTLDQLEKLLNE